MLEYVLAIVGVVMLIKGADFLVEGASSIAKKFNMSDLVIGLTVISIGTSTPELFVNITAASKGVTDIAVGNIIGSNIANIFLILGVTVLICPVTVTKDIVWKQVPFCLLSALALGVMANDTLIDGMNKSALTRSDGISLIFLFIIFMYYLFESSKNSNTSEQSEESGKALPMWKAFLYIIIGLVGLAYGSDWIVEGASKFAKVIGISDKVVGLTMVALGTSLPELAASIAAARKGKVQMALGNVIGSNVLNVFLILGISSMIFPLPFSPDMNLDILVMIGANLLVFIFMFTGGRYTVDRWEGGVLLSIYIGYSAYLFTQLG